jgi:hypothetical protein
MNVPESDFSRYCFAITRSIWARWPRSWITQLASSWRRGDPAQARVESREDPGLPGSASERQIEIGGAGWQTRPGLSRVRPTLRA